MKFRERDGVCIQYMVVGDWHLEEEPYADGLSSFKEAVRIARSYQSERGTGWVRIIRSYDSLCPQGSRFHHVGGFTHEWEIGGAGEIRRTIVYTRWKLDKRAPSIKRTWNNYLDSLPKPEARLMARSLDSQLSDLEQIADRLGYTEAERHLVDARFERQRAADAFHQSKEEKGDVLSSRTFALKFISRWLQIIRKSVTGSLAS